MLTDGWRKYVNKDDSLETQSGHYVIFDVKVNNSNLLSQLKSRKFDPLPSENAWTDG